LSWVWGDVCGSQIKWYLANFICHVRDIGGDPEGISVPMCSALLIYWKSSVPK